LVAPERGGVTLLQELGKRQRARRTGVPGGPYSMCKGPEAVGSRNRKMSGEEGEQEKP
jgi:hypothetical protein